MKNKINYLLIAACLLMGMSLQAQDIHFSQFYMSPLQQNPAFAGSQHDLQATLNYRDQWRSVTADYKTVAASYDMKFKKLNSEKGFLAAGLSFFSDKAGDSKMGLTQANFSLAYHILLNKNSTFGGGLMGGYAQRSIGYSSLQWASQYDGIGYNSGMPTGEVAGNSTKAYPDFGAGLLYAYKKSEKYATGNDQRTLNFGLALFHVNRPGISFYGNSSDKLNMKFVAHGEALIGLPNSNLSIVPGFLYYRQGSQQEIYAGTMFKYLLQESSKYTGKIKGAAVSVGAYYRNQDAVSFLTLLEYSNYAIGVSYDMNISRLSTVSGGKGGIEISLRLINPAPFLYNSHSMF